MNQGNASFSPSFTPQILQATDRPSLSAPSSPFYLHGPRRNESFDRARATASILLSSGSIPLGTGALSRRQPTPVPATPSEHGGSATQRRLTLEYAKERYQALIDAADDAILIVDTESAHFVEINRAACEVLGYSADELMGLTGRQLHPASEADKIDQLSLSINTTGKGHNPAMRFKRKDGSLFWGSVRMWSYEFQGRATYVCIIRDVTDHVEREEELAARVQELRETQAKLILAGRLSAMGALSAGIAHELNQPLTAIQGFTQRLLRHAEEPLAQHIDELQIIAAEARRMAAIVDNIRTFARASDFDPRPVEATRPVLDAMMLIKRQLDGHGVVVRVTEDATIPPVWGDGAKLQQVFLNLLTNARDALVELAPDRERRVEVSVTQEDGFIVYRVDDSGPGVPENLIPRLFDPFVTTKPPGKGTGLGLSLIYGIIADHDGDISYERSPLGGARFTFRVHIAR